MISGVAFLCIHAQIKNSVLSQIPTGPVVRSQTMCGKQQHIPSSTENSWWKIRCTAAFFHFTPGSQAGLWYFFPSASDEPGWKKCPAFFCVCVTPFLCRWVSAGTSHAVWIASGVLCWDKRDRFDLFFFSLSTETAASLKASQDSRWTREKKMGFYRPAVERITLHLSCHAHCMGSFTPVQWCVHCPCFSLWCAEYPQQQTFSIF